MASDLKEEEMPNWTDLVNNHSEKADAVKTAVGCALKHVTEALFDLVVRNEWRKVHGEQADTTPPHQIKAYSRHA